MHGLWRTSEKLSGAADEALHLRLELEIAKISFQKIGEFKKMLRGPPKIFRHPKGGALKKLLG